MTKEFGLGLPTYADRVSGETARIAEMKAQATPPGAMHAAAVAPARGIMQLVPNWEILPGGTRRADGAHWIEASPLDVANVRAVDRALAKDPEASRAKAEVFSPGQVAMAKRYRDLVEWRAGSAIKCGKLEGGSGAGGAGEFIDSYITAGEELARLEAAIGREIILSPRRHMDRDNARRPLSLRVAFDAMVLRGWSLSKVITKHGWSPKGATRRQVRDAIRGALDRMQGYH